ncbi:MAG TPA: hypothetical protein VGM89_12635 [Puia sp.]|jgi:hypothetical protein
MAGILDFNSDLLHNKWVYHPEEDTETEKVYRPADPAVLSRNRSSFQLHKDGTLIQTSIGADDRPGTSTGSWTLAGNRLSFYPESGKAPSHEMEIAALAPDKLTIKK